MSWTSYWHVFMENAINHLLNIIERIKADNPERLRHHPAVALYVSVMDAMKRVREDPQEKCYYLGKTLGASHKDWRRAKDGLPDRYRLFFKFFSREKEIFFVWLNDENTLRKAGAKSDCYAVFKRMLERGEIPSDGARLKDQSTKKEF